MAAERLSPIDPNSYSRPDLCKVNDIFFDLQVDFQRQILHGFATLTATKVQSDVDNLILDTRNLFIKSICDAESKTPLSYEIQDAILTFGSKLIIQLPKCNSNEVKIKIGYETVPSCTALQWLNPQQTAGKKEPYLFSQCQAIQARSMLPCQDTPAVKAPYKARITAPKSLTVLMSAIEVTAPVVSEDGLHKVYEFWQKVPIPSYLIAIVVGALESREISDRCRVWSEKEFVDLAAQDFSETEAMLSIGEQLMGPYIWGRYDILVLPPSFPFGGMENPCLTFVSPTLLTGDRSLADVIAHEIAHSWTGNLVTNATFEEFWLNEGFTVFTERKIAGRMFGEQYRQFAAIGGWKTLRYTIGVFGPENRLTDLVPDLTGIDPDDAFSSVPYEKGHSFLFYLEKKVGGPDVFEPFMRAYIEKFSYKSLVTEEWKTFLLEYFREKGMDSLLSDVDWDAWLHKPGMPPVNLEFDTSLADVCVALAKKWVGADPKDLSCFNADDIKDFSTLQSVEFLSLLLEEDPLPIEKVKCMADVYQFHARKNAEILFHWVRLGIRCHWKDIIELALKFVTDQGRMKFIRPVYRDLYAWEVSREQAVQTYKDHKHEMMYVAAYTVAKDLQLAK